jgi:hypothetical protein
MNRALYIKSIISHYEQLWGKDYRALQWEKEPSPRLPQGFHVLEFKPTKKRNMWTYATVGMSTDEHKRPIELHMFSPYQTDRMVELLTVVACYHHTGAPLGLNHRINFGQPWLEQSICTRGFISLPYLDGPKLETLCLEETHVGFYWLIPISEQEAAIVDAEGVEGLESRFETQAFNYSDPKRSSVV